MILSELVWEGICVIDVVIFVFLYLTSCLGSYTVDYFNNCTSDKKERIKIMKVLLSAFPATLFSLTVFNRITSINFLLIFLIAYMAGFCSFKILTNLSDKKTILGFFKELIEFLIDRQ